MSGRAQDCEFAAARARRYVLRMMEAGRSGHVGGALSAIDIVTAIYLSQPKLAPAWTDDPDRDRFLLSAGHKVMAQYAVLAVAGIIPVETLDTYGQLSSKLPGHPDMGKLKGVEANTGALGHGLPIACGMALGAKLSGSSSRVFVVLGDGELPEGSNWEGAAIASHHKLDNLVAFVDVNGLQISGPTRDVMNMSSIADKFGAFGWATEQIDGNDMGQILDVLDRVPLGPGRPTAIIAYTTKAKGIRSIEGLAPSHYWKPSDEDLWMAIADAEKAIVDAEKSIEALEGAL